ncbi:MAG: SPASM domain-containing protein [Calditrichota bacterium]
MISNHPQARSEFHVLAKPIGPICNLDCEYCFYLRKKELFPETRNFRMTDEVLDKFTRQYIEAQPANAKQVDFAWQGGEPTLMGIDFFQKAIRYQKKFARPGMRITNSLQTNGYVGRFADRQARRRHRRGCRMLGLEVLQKHRVEFNTLTVVQSDNSRYPGKVYDFLKAIGSTFFQFIPIVEKEPAEGVSYRSVPSVQSGWFLSGVFDRWLEQEDVGKIFVQDFDLLLAQVMGMPSTLCVHSETCGRSVAIEHNGDLFSCDHFVNLEDRIGNVMSYAMADMLDGSQQNKFGQDKHDTLPQYCLDCEFLSYCNGGCPKDRILDSPGGEPGLNYLCKGYKVYYSHTIPIFEKMAECLRMGRPASDYKIVDRLKRREYEDHNGKVGRNDPCPCGSGKKFKKCCGR